jgi:hypothetical protein
MAILGYMFVYVQIKHYIIPYIYIYIYMYIYRHTRAYVIQKLSSICEYCRCSAAVTMVCMRAESFESLSRHGHSLQKQLQKLVQRYDKCLNNGGNYVEK